MLYESKKCDSRQLGAIEKAPKNRDGPFEMENVTSFDALTLLPRNRATEARPILLAQELFQQVQLTGKLPGFCIKAFEIACELSYNICDLILFEGGE